MTDKLRSAGAKLANIAFNLAQSKDLPADILACLDAGRKEWDEAVRAPSAQVAPPITEKMATFYLSTSGEYCTHQVGDCKVPVWLKDHSNAEAFMLIMDSLLSRASAALSVQAEPAAIPDGWKLVPIEPTEAMLSDVDEEVGGHCYSCSAWSASWDDCKRVYAAMLAAAPTPPTTGEA